EEDKVSELKRKLAVDPRDMQSRRRLAELLRKLNRPVEALAQWQILAASGELSLEDNLNRADVLVACGKILEARDLYTSLLQSARSHAQQLRIYDAWIEMYIAVGMKREAIDLATKAAAMCRTSAEQQHFRVLASRADAVKDKLAIPPTAKMSAPSPR